MPEPLFAQQPALWTGFVRTPGSRWLVVCTAATWSECWDLLLARKVKAAHVEQLATQRDPNRRG